MKNILIAVDLGASVCKIYTGYLSHDKLYIAEKHRFKNIPISLNEELFWDFPLIYKNIMYSLNNIISEENAQYSIGIDSWGVDFGLLYKDKYLLGNPLHYRNMFKTKIMEETVERIGKKWIFEKAPTQFQPFNTLYQILFYQKYLPDILNISTTMLTIPSLINFFLTGSKVIDFTMATTTQIYNPLKKCWSSDIIKYFKIPDIFPDVVPAGTIVGDVKKDIIGRKNVKVVMPASHDTASAYASICSDYENTLILSLGTWCLTGIVLKEIELKDEIMNENLAIEGCLDGSYRVLANVTGLWLIEKLIEYWNLPGSTEIYEQLVRMAESATDFASFFDVDDKILQYTNNMEESIVEASMKFCGTKPKNREEFIRTALESIAFKIRKTREKLESIFNTKLSKAHIIGGGIRNTLLCQLIANALNLRVFTGPIEGTAVGNIISQLYSLKIVKTFQDIKHIIEHSFDIKEYQPMDIDNWEKGYINYTKFYKQKESRLCI